MCISFVLAAMVAGVVACSALAPKQPIRVGILHSLSGTMAISETSVADASKLAVEELNERGGVLGRPVEAVIADGKSDWTVFAEEAERLIARENVSAVFGCWTSAARKTVKPVFEKHNHLLFYPVQSEGLEESPNIVYTGASPNQQIIPAVKWSFDNIGKRFFLVGSDYVFPRTANAIMRDQITALGGEIIGEEYLPFGGTDVKDIIEKIVASKPSVILNTINGDGNIAFFQALRAAGITSETLPTISFSVAEEELNQIDPKLVAGDFAAWNYFQSVQSEENRAFVERFKKKYGADRVTDDPIEAGYFGVKLWARAVEEAGTEDVVAVLDHVKRQSLNAPSGIVYVDPDNLHAWKIVRIGKIRADGQFDIVWSSEKPVRPVPFPIYRSKEQWLQLLDELHTRWGGGWANPGKRNE